MELKNRNVEYPNRFRIEVINMNGDYVGTIETMSVRIYRDEGEVYESGTPLDEKTVSLLFQGYYIENDTVQIIKGQQISEASQFIIFTVKQCVLSIIETVESPFVLEVSSNEENVIAVSLNTTIDTGTIGEGIYTNKVKLLDNNENVIVEIELKTEVLPQSVSSDD